MIPLFIDVTARFIWRDIIGNGSRSIATRLPFPVIQCIQWWYSEFCTVKDKTAAKISHFCKDRPKSANSWLVRYFLWFDIREKLHRNNYETGNFSKMSSSYSLYLAELRVTSLDAHNAQLWTFILILLIFIRKSQI